MNEPYTVSQIAAILRDTLESNFDRIAVKGEISECKLAPSGHWYITLKEGGSILYCTCWKSDAMRLKFRPALGLEIVATGRMTFYGPQSKTQMAISTMQPVGAGAAELAKQQLIAKLRSLGWFDESRKQPLPRFPRRVALLTSSTGAAVRDMIQSFALRWPACELIVKHTRVQGDGAPQEIAQGLKELNALHANKDWPLDAIILGRGGGGAEDLNAFNAEIVAAAIHASKVPVVSAVGHEIDVTIADLVADARSETPSNAVTRLTPNRLELLQDLDQARQRLREALTGKLANARRRLEFIAERAAFRRPQDRLRRREQMLDDLAKRLKQAIDRKLETKRANLAKLAATLEAVSPLAVLKRGYGIVRHGDVILRDSAELKPGDELAIVLAKGQVAATVTRTSP